MTGSNSDNGQLVPGWASSEHAHGLARRGVAVIYVSVDEPPPRARCFARGGGLFSSAASCLHRMADRVDDVRRSIERARDGVAG